MYVPQQPVAESKRYSENAILWTRFLSASALMLSCRKVSVLLCVDEE